MSEVVFNMYHEARKCRVIFRRKSVGSYNESAKSVYSCQVQDNSAVFKTVDITNMNETDFLERLHETLEQGFILTQP